MTNQDFYFYVYPELVEKHKLTLFEYSVLEILAYKSPKGSFYGDKDKHLAEVLDSSYDYVCRIVRNLIKKGWLKKKKKAVIDSHYDELEVNEKWHKEINQAIDKQNADKYYKRFQFFPALMVEAKMTLKQYIVSLSTEILQTSKTSKIARFAGVCRQTVYNTFEKCKDYFENVQEGLKKVSERFKKMKDFFTQKAVNKDYHQAMRASKNFQREQEKQHQQTQTQKNNPPPNPEREAQIQKLLEEELKRKRETEQSQKAREEEQRKKNQTYYDKVFGGSS
jgi:DNA-binding MarR family transcriptional regulator